MREAASISGLPSLLHVRNIPHFPQPFRNASSHSGRPGRRMTVLATDRHFGCANSLARIRSCCPPSVEFATA
jgi:hypothetical protein